MRKINRHSVRRTLIYCLLLTAGLAHSACGNPSARIQPPSNPGLTPEPGEELSGGATTVVINTDKSFSQFAANLTFSQQGDFKIGNSFFEQDWVEAPASTTARDGLGPVFNARACSSCHQKDGRGSPPAAPGDPTLSLLFRLSLAGVGPNGDAVPEPNYGTQLNPRANLHVPAEGEVEVSYEEITGAFADGEQYALAKPNYRFIDLAFGDLDPNTLFSPRIAQQMIGMGLLEAVAEETVLSRSDPDDTDGDGISGKPNRLWDETLQAKTLGRFGWKANQPSVAQQVAGAFLGDIGLTSSIFPDENCTAVQTDCLNALNGGTPEVTDDIFDFVVFYSQTLAVPARRNWTDPTVLKGKNIFGEIGCASCHLPKLTTRSDYEITELAGQTIRPYTDLLLHDMGDGLADNRPDFDADGREWRTPPLWGIGLVDNVNGHTRFLHDGRARNLEEAVLWHGGEASGAQQAYVNLSQEDRQALLAFLNSL